MLAYISNCTFSTFVFDVNQIVGLESPGRNVEILMPCSKHMLEMPTEHESKLVYGWLLMFMLEGKEDGKLHDISAEITEPEMYEKICEFLLDNTVIRLPIYHGMKGSKTEKSIKDRQHLIMSPDGMRDDKKKMPFTVTMPDVMPEEQTEKEEKETE